MRCPGVCPGRGSGGNGSLVGALVPALVVVAACAKENDFTTVFAAKFPMAVALSGGNPMATACAAIDDDACVACIFL